MRRLFTYGLLLFTVLSFAQAKPKKDKDQEKGNKEFAQNNYVQAEADYRISRSKSPAGSSAAYNQGNAIYRQGQSAEAAYAYVAAIKNARTKQQKHMAYHNLGNIFMKEKNYQEAVEAYKNALRNNPADEQTRYNYALAKEMLKKNPPKPQKPPEGGKDKKDQNKDSKSQQPNNGGSGDQKDKGDKGDNKDKSDQKDKGGDKGDQKSEGDQGQPKDDGDQKDKGKPKPEAGQNPSKQRMENLLDAMNNEEKKIQDKINGRKVKAKPNNNQQKDW
jgi:tetratricopeptide (TPR) repeat protein